MLTQVSIKDFAIIEDVNMEFGKGLHVLTGETGAGKSILIEAMSMALGSRADTTYIRSGKDKAVIELSALPTKQNLSFLESKELSDNENLIITREIFQGGKSIARINGTAVSLSILNALSSELADIHGQYDNQSLLDPESHLVILDRYGKTTIETKALQVKELFFQYDEAKARLDKLLAFDAESARSKDFMEFELNEIKNAGLVPEEDDLLNERLNILKNGELLSSSLNECYELLYGDNQSALDKLSLSMGILEQIKDFSAEYSQLSESITSSYYNLEDLKSTLRKLKESIDFSPEAINLTQERLDLIDRLKKKYGSSIDKILEYQDELEERLNSIENSGHLIASAKEQVHKSYGELKTAADELSHLRRKAAEKMEKDVESELRELNFKDSRLVVSFRELTKDGKQDFTPGGSDLVEFLMITNKGETPKPLAKIASGGEISRIMLAFKKILGNFDNIPCLIFDEIDNGISGATASIVGSKLKEISETHQVICITHLAQIAAFADHHYQIYKEESENRTITSVKRLDENERIEEIARLLGGLHITEATLKNARELISQSQ